MSIHICNISQSRESPLRTPLRGYGSETWALIHFTRSLRQDWSTLVPLTPYQAWHLGFEDDLRLRRYLASWNIPSPCWLSSILSPWLPSVTWVRRGDQRMLCLVLPRYYCLIFIMCYYLQLYICVICMAASFFLFKKERYSPFLSAASHCRWLVTAAELGLHSARVKPS